MRGIRRRWKATAMAMLVATVFGAIAMQGEAATRHCTAGKTLAADHYARVFGKHTDKAYVCVKATGLTRRLQGASASGDQFALGGKWVAWSSGSSHSVVTVMHIPHGFVDSYWYPFDTNDHVDKVVVKSDGAAAWAATASDGSTLVQGTDRFHHPPDQFSDDTKTVKTHSLKSDVGHKISWRYTDGTTGTANLY